MSPTQRRVLAWGFEKDDLGILGSDKVPGVQGSVIWICLFHAWGFRVTIFDCTEQCEYVLHAGLPELDPILPASVGSHAVTRIWDSLG